MILVKQVKVNQKRVLAMEVQLPMAPPLIMILGTKG